MNYKLIFFLFIVFLNSCMQTNSVKFPKEDLVFIKFSNKGFALIYDSTLFENKIVNKKINDRDLIIFQKNLKKNTSVKISNPSNGKSVIAKVGKNSIYPNFNNSVISKRISVELDLNLDDPYIFIEEILQNSTFIAKKAKTFEIEKQVADKAPVDSISINNLSNSNTKKVKKKKQKKKFKYSIKVADFYFEKTSKTMINKIKAETSLKNVKMTKISKNKFRVYLGPYSDLKTLQKAYNGIEKLNFENIEIIRND